MKHIALPISAAVLLTVTSAIGLTPLPVVQADATPEVQTAAAERTVTFTVEKMTCAACPITVRQAMQKVEGVKSVTVDFETKTATVVFDPAVTTPEQIAAASTNAGYPATPAS